MLSLFLAPVAVEGRAGAFGGDHRRAEGCSGVQPMPKAGQSKRLLQPCKICPAMQCGDSLVWIWLTSKRCSASKALQLRAQAPAAQRNGANAAPVAVDRLEDALDAPGPRGCLQGHARGIGVLHFHLAFFQHRTVIRMPCTRSSGSKPVTCHRHAVLLGDGRVLPVAHHRADVPGCQKALHAVVRRAEDGVHGRRHAAPAKPAPSSSSTPAPGPAARSWHWPGRWFQSRWRRRPPVYRGSPGRCAPRPAANRPPAPARRARGC
jgi:hypothetical protein